MSSSTLSHFVSPQLIGHSPKISEITALPAKTSSKRGAIHSANFSRTSSALAKEHQDFDRLLAELHSDDSLADELAEASKWVADHLYADQADTLKTARLRKGFSQAKLAELIGTSQPHVANLERAHGDVMFSTAEKLCRALEISMNDMSAMIDRQREINAARGKK